MLIYFFWIIFIFFTEKISCDSIAVPLSLKYGTYYLSLSLIHQKANLELPINLSSQYTIVTSSSFRISPETKSSPLRIPYLNEKIDLETAYYNKDNVSIFPAVNLYSFPFYYIQYFSSNFDTRLESIPFAFKFDDESFSVTHQLFNKKLISHLSFALISEENNKKSLVFGKNPSKMKTHSSSAQLKVKSEYNTWGSELSYIFLDKISYISKNTFYTNKYYTFFDAGLKGIHVPADFYQFVMDNIFKSYVEKNKCRDVIFSEATFFVCDTDIIGTFPDLIFVFENQAIKLPMKKVFAPMGSTSDLLMVPNTIINDTFILGNSFISEYDAMFDYQEKKISFYSNNRRIETVNFAILFPQKKIIVLIALGLVAILGVFWYKYGKKFLKKKRNQKFKESFLALKPELNFNII